MKIFPFLTNLFLLHIISSQPVFSQIDNNIGGSQVLLANNVNPVQRSRNINAVQTQGKLNFELENEQMQVKNPSAQVQAFNNEVRNFNSEAGNSKVLSPVRLPDISFGVNNGSAVKGFSKKKNKEKLLDKCAYKVNKKIKKSFRKKKRGRNKSVNGCFAW